MGLLVGWVVLQLIPLPPAVVAHLSPARWNDVAAARAATGQYRDAWIPLSVAPPATLEALLNLLPALAAFVATRELAWRWTGRIWWVVGPVAVIGWLESLLGLTQFYFMRASGGEVESASGTYLSRNHFSGLLEMAFPLAVMAAFHIWRQGATRTGRPAGAALRASAWMIAAACMLTAVIVSLSRMGFFSTLAAAGLLVLGALAARGGASGGKRRWLWIIPVAIGVPLCILFFLSTTEMVLRFADVTGTEDVSAETRVKVWRDTTHTIAAYPLTGCGFGAYQQCFYRFQTVSPANTVDAAHNDYLQILCELGWPGALLVAGIGAWILSRLLPVVLGNPGARNWHLALALLAAFLALGLHSLADFNLYIPANALVLAWLGGVAASPGLAEN